VNFYLKNNSVKFHPDPDPIETRSFQPYFLYGCALRCVARAIETLLASLYLFPRNATRSRNGNRPLGFFEERRRRRRRKKMMMMMMMDDDE